MPIVLETFEEFKKRMGCEAVYFRDRYRFANGATSDGRLAHGEPPTDPTELKRVRRAFLEAKLNIARGREERLLRAIDAQLEFFTHDAGPDPDEAFPHWEADLTAFRTEIADLEKEIKSINNSLPERESLIAHEQRREARVGQARDILKRLHDIR